jgi:hypothetical protein
MTELTHERRPYADLMHGRANPGRILLAYGRMFRATTRRRWYKEFLRAPPKRSLMSSLLPNDHCGGLEPRGRQARRSR